MEPVTAPTTEPTEKPTTERTTELTTERTTVKTTVPTSEPTATPQVGWLTIASTPTSASVSLDGSSVGVTPVAGVEVAAGTSHTVKVTMNGYEPYSSTVRVSAGEESAVDATLTPITTPAPTAEPTITVGPVVGSDKGWFRIHTNVDGAKASLDHGSSGTCTISSGSCSIEVSTTGTPVKTFTVEKSGYTAATNSVTGMPAKGETLDLYATLNPIAAYGSIRVTSSPSGAVAYLDGSSWQYTPCTFEDVSANTNHQIKVSMNGYKTYTKTVTVYADDTEYVSANLAPSPSKTGSLYVTTTPSGADIYVDGGYLAESPSTVPGLSPGSHSIRLHKTGYNEYVGSVTIYAGEQTPVSIVLSSQSSNVGSIEVSSVPGGSALYVDSQYVGLTPASGYFDATSLVPGYHAIILRHTDYRDYSQSVYVPAGGSATVNAVLAQVSTGPTQDTTGQIVIASSPPGAEVYIDNAYMGATPITVPNVASGSHTLILKLSGYSDSTQTITVSGGQSTPVAVTLTPAEPTPTEKSPGTVAPVIAAFAVAGAFLLGRRS
ncbi:MAG TPA: PEGA domain-containing protein [Methanoregulaceae archaeon]|nr:PEGA domain-containing protein [Methanoregulaceae archaeon]